MPLLTRRTLVTGITTTALLMPSAGFSAVRRVITPSATEGPFYPDRLPLRTDNDLVSIVPGGEPAKGQIFHLFGRVMSTDGAPMEGFTLEIWQCDANGVYQHSGDRDRGPFDPNFQGFGKTVTDKTGAYRFRTITPVSYPGRTPHIHFKIKAPNRREFTSQMYLDGHPRNEGDFLFNRLGSDSAKKAASVRQVPASELDDKAVKGTFDIVLR